MIEYICLEINKNQANTEEEVRKLVLKEIRNFIDKDIKKEIKNEEIMWIYKIDKYNLKKIQEKDKEDIFYVYNISNNTNKLLKELNKKNYGNWLVIVKYLIN